MVAAATKTNKRGRIISMDPWTTTCLETFTEEENRDWAGEQRVPVRHGYREQRVL